MGLDWYWWVLIGAVVIVGGYVKLKIFKKLMEKKNDNIDNE